MANNIDVTPGTGKTVAAEEIGAVIYQQVKLLDATATSTTPTGVAANPLQVSLANTSANATAVKVDGSAVTQPVSGSVTALPGTGATNLGKAEDAAHSSGDVGVMSLAVQKGTPADVSSEGDYAPLQVSGGRLWVDPSGVTLTVASHAVTNAGTFAVQTTAQVPGTGATNLGKAEDAVAASGDTGVMALAVRSDTAAATGADGDYVPLLTDSTGRLHANVSNTLTVASHAVTNAGTFAVQVTSQVPGVAATNLGKAEDAAHTSGDTGVMSLAVRNDAGGTLSGTDGDYSPLQVNSAGALYVTGGGGGTQYVEAAAAAADPTGTALNLISVATPGNEVTAGQNVAARGTIKGELYVKQTDAVPVTDNSGSLTVDNNGTFVVQENGSQVQVDDAAFTPGTSKIVMAGFEADESSTDSVDEGDGGAARMTLDRKQIVVSQPHTNGGCLIANMTSGDSFTALTNTAQAIKASAGQLYGWYIYNPNATATYVIIYNTAAGSVTVGTTNPAMVLCIPPTSAANLLGAVGIEFTNAGFSAAATTTGGGNTAPGTALEANFFYK
jgi:hypothetical protein